MSEGRKMKMWEGNSNLMKDIMKTFIYLSKENNRYKKLSSIIDLLDQLRIDEPMLPWNFINKIQKRAFCKEKILKKIKQEKEETIILLEKERTKLIENILQIELTVKSLENLERFQENTYFILRQEGIKKALNPSYKIKDITKYVVSYNLLLYRIKETTKLFKQIQYQYSRLLLILNYFLEFYNNNFLCSKEKMKEEIQKEEYESIVFKSLLNTIDKYQRRKDEIDSLFQEISCKRGEVSKQFFFINNYL